MAEGPVARDPHTRRQSLLRRPLPRALLGAAITAAFVALVHQYVGWATLIRPWREVAPAPVATAAALLLLTHALRALRVHDYFGAPVRHRRRACLRLVLQHNLFNNLLPMRTGELAFPVLMARRFGIKPGVTVPGLLWFRALDLHSVILFALPALLGHVPRLAAAAAALWLALPWLVRRHGHGPIQALGHRVPVRAARLLEGAWAGVPRADAVFWRTYGWTLANWALKLFVFAWLLMLFAPLQLSSALLGAIGGEMTSVLPVHGIAGVGTYEAGVVAALAPGGMGVEMLVRAAVNLHLFVLGVTLGAGALAFLPAGHRRV